MQDHAPLVHKFFTGTGASYDRIVSLCTFGADSWWKHKILSGMPGKPRRVLDQACGTGILTFKIARTFPQCQVVGVDVTEEYLAVAKEKATRFGLANVQFLRGRAEEVVPDGPFDCITSSYLAKYADLERLVAHAAGMLRPGGTLLMHDFCYPANAAFARLWEFYFSLLQTGGARWYPEWRSAFDGLPGLLRETKWIEDLLLCLEHKGFRNVTVQYFTLHTSALVTATIGWGSAPPRLA